MPFRFILFLLLASSAFAAGPNLIKNPGFETTSVGGKPAGFSVFELVPAEESSVVSGGYRSMKSLKIAGAKATAYQYDIPVRPGEAFVVRAFARQQGQGKITLSANWKTPKRQWNWDAGTNVFQFPDKKGEWQVGQLEVQGPAQGVAYLSVVLAAEEQPGANDAAFFDEVQVTQIDGLKESLDGKDSQAVLFGFERSLRGRPPFDWQIAKGDNESEVIVDAVGYKSGASLKIAGADANVSAQYDFPVKAGEVVAFEVFGKKAGYGEGTLSVSCLDAAKALNHVAGVYHGKFRAFESDWRRAQVRVHVPDGVSYLRLALGGEKQPSLKDAFWFDQIKVTREGLEPIPTVAPNDKAPLVDVRITPEENPAPKSNLEALHTLRMASVKHSDVEGSEKYKWITPSKARDYARSLRESGYNVVLTEGQRFLMTDPGPHAPYPDVLNGSLPFPELVENTKAITEACQAEGLKVYLHLTAGAASKDNEAGQMAVSVNDGKPRTIWGLEWLCLNNPAFQEEYFKRLEKLVAETKADGLMVDETTLMFDSCGCAICRAKFAKDTKLQMPAQGEPWLRDLSNPVYRAFLQWRLKVTTEFNDRIRSTLRKHSPEGELLSYYANPYNPNAWYEHGFSVELAGKISRPLGFEMISDYSRYWPLYVANIKFVRSVAEHSDGDIYVIANPPDYDGIYNHWIKSLSQGAHQYWPWYIPDSVKEQRKPLVQWETKYQNLLAGLRGAASTGVVISTRNNNLHRAPLGSVSRQNAFFAVANTLTMARVPFKVLGDLDLEKPLVDKADLVVALNLALVSDAEAAHLRQFVESGGTLVVSSDFSLYDEQGNKRKNFALADLLGADYVSTIKDDGVLTVTEKSPILGDVTGQFDSPDDTVVVVPREGAKVLGTIKVGSQEVPGLLQHTVGRGQVIYFAGQIEPLLYFNELMGNQIVRRSYGEKRDEQFEKLFLFLVENTSKERLTVSNLPKGVVVEAFDQKFDGVSRYAVSLLNYTGMMTDGQPEAQGVRYPDIRAQLPDPTGPIRITLKGQAGKAFAISPDFSEKRELALVRGEGEVSVELPTFGNFMMVYFE